MRIASIFIALAFAPAALAQPDFIAKVRTRVDQEMTTHKIVGLSLAIAKDGKLIAQESFGFEDREANIAASNETMYRWASVSKPLTAVVTMQLVKEGKLNLDADVRTLVPEFPEKPWPVTSRQLLCHQGGIVHYANGKVIKSERTYDTPNPFKDTILALDNFKESPLVNEPGTKYSYTTHGYMLLGAVAQRAAKMPYADLVKARISTPCGMTTLQPDYQWIDIPHSAVGYRKDAAGEMARSSDTDVSWKLPGGGFISTATDMARFGMGMLSGKLVDDATRAQMWTKQKTRDGQETPYGLGFSIGQEDSLRYIHHSGAQEKAATHLVIVPDRGVVIALMSNTEGIRLGNLALDLNGLLDDQTIPKPPPAK